MKSLKIGQATVVSVTRKNRGPSYGPETKWATGTSKETASAVLGSLEQVKTHADELLESMVHLKDYAPALFSELQAKVTAVSETITEAYDEYRQFTR